MCNVEGCDKPAKSKGLCHNHYCQDWRNSNRERVRACAKARYHADPQKQIASSCKWRTRNPDRVRVTNRRSSGRSIGWFDGLEDEMFVLQRGLCGICQTELNFEVKKGNPGCHRDHCHETGKPRGLLCRACNQALGNYQKSQKPAGLLIEPYECYLTNPPTRHKIG
jgi:hypothetical protein